MLIEYEWTVAELCDGEARNVASGTAPLFDVAKREMEHYAAQYAQDGPIEARLYIVQRILVAGIGIDETQPSSRSEQAK